MVIANWEVFSVLVNEDLVNSCHLRNVIEAYVYYASIK